MNKIEKAQKIIEEALVGVTKRITEKDKIKNDQIFLNQLNHMKTLLEEMLKEVKTQNLPPKEKRYPGMGYVIADSWDYNDELGSKIISAEEAYQKL